MTQDKINVAELLKDCPKGMELDCAMYENVTLFCASDSGAYPIKIETPDGLVALDKYGCYSSNEHAKCVIFPKGKTTWEGFVPPCGFKDGDVVVTRTKVNAEHSNLAEQIAHKVGGGNSRLSPLFTEEMMGFPLMWTALPFLSESGAPKPSKPTATPSFHK